MALAEALDAAPRLNVRRTARADLRGVARADLRRAKGALVCVAAAGDSAVAIIDPPPMKGSNRMGFAGTATCARTARLPARTDRPLKRCVRLKSRLLCLLCRLPGLWMLFFFTSACCAPCGFDWAVSGTADPTTARESAAMTGGQKRRYMLSSPFNVLNLTLRDEPPLARQSVQAHMAIKWQSDTVTLSSSFVIFVGVLLFRYRYLPIG
jgi:hypothetical protein